MRTIRPVDIFYHEENPAAIQILGVSVKGKTLTELSPDYEPYWYEIFGKVALTGENKRLEQYSQHDEKCSTFTLPDKVIKTAGKLPLFSTMSLI